MAKILVLIPMKPNLNPRLKEIAAKLANALRHDNPLHALDVIIDERGGGDSGIMTLEDRVAHTSPIRQGMVDEYLNDHEYVLWIDADIVQYDSNLPSELIHRNPRGVSAPVVLLEGFDKRFYDIAGFVESGTWCRIDYPWFNQAGPVYELDGVGAVYIVPAEVYRRGGKHAPCPPFTEHLNVCSKARELGMPVRAYEDLVAYHAYLPNYGECIH